MTDRTSSRAVIWNKKEAHWEMIPVAFFSFVDDPARYVHTGSHFRRGANRLVMALRCVHWVYTGSHFLRFLRFLRSFRICNLLEIKDMVL
jgi:hypothetical protein